MAHGYARRSSKAPKLEQGDKREKTTAALFAPFALLASVSSAMGTCGHDPIAVDLLV